ncbi:MAG: carboxypeptidase-like regulatory domain-containing protein, partial [Pseudomonadota bacterium]|nr:carboxypeptidase-like regulatory domain-containing protein [Pseudomonadota bacterium]
MMRPTRYKTLSLMIASLVLAACSGQDEPAATTTTATPASAPAVAEMANDNISGQVNGPNGPEAGVWVIAETRELGTRYAKIVVTDDAGNYLIPDLPAANYDVWVRGYGLVDSAKVAARPGATLALTASIAPDAAAAAEYYPAGYWFSMLQVPPESAFPG